MNLRVLGLLAVLGASCAAPAPPTGTRQPLRCDEHAACPRGHTCRWQRSEGKVVGECRLDVGHCFSDWDCAPGLRCQRFDAEVGTCLLATI